MKFIAITALLGRIRLDGLPAQAQTNSTFHICDSPIYCPGPLLQKVQLAHIYNDSKIFVDKPTSKPLADVLSAFAALSDNATVREIQAFVDANFLTEGRELVPATLTDFVPKPKFLDSISDNYLNGFASQVHGYWPNLTRQVNNSFLCDGCVSSFLPASKRSFVVPGERFREGYYWDTYFVLEGLLLSELYETSKNMILNFLDFVDTYGFMPNGARIYYLNRSQPPFLIQMVKAYYAVTKDTELLARALPTLDTEYAFWQKNTSLDVTDPSTGKTYRLNHYNVQNSAPRPEAYFEDYNTVANGTGFNETHQASLYADLATGAETGWDYSSRWVAENVPNEGTGTLRKDVLQYSQTRSIVPVELNSLLYANEITLSDFHKIQACGGDRGRSAWYKRVATERLAAMGELLWDDASNTFQDWDIVKGGRRSQFTLSNYYPYWAGAFPPNIASDVTKLKNAFVDIDTQLQKYPGLITTTEIKSGLQWDFPNGWPPLQYILINALRSVSDRLNTLTRDPSAGKHLQGMAFKVAQRFASSAYCGWYKTGLMFEKYDVTTVGLSGGGGEYEAQSGFGWTNGVALWTLNAYGDKLVAPNLTECD